MLSHVQEGFAMLSSSSEVEKVFKWRSGEALLQVELGQLPFTLEGKKVLFNLDVIFWPDRAERMRQLVRTSPPPSKSEKYFLQSIFGGRR